MALLIGNLSSGIVQNRQQSRSLWFAFVNLLSQGGMLQWTSTTCEV
jgi:hypothetical protein